MQAATGGSSPAAAAAAEEFDFVAVFKKNFPTPPPNGKPYNVCVPDAALPYAYCASESATPSDPENVLGYEAAAVRKLLEDGYLAEWTYGRDWQFLCMGSKEDIRADLTSAAPQCLVAAMGQDVTEDALKQGIRFSYFPTERSGIAPFHWSVWLTWIVLTLVMVLVVYLAETSTANDSNRYTKGWKGFYESALNTLFFSFNRKGPTLGEVSSTPARVLAIFWVFFLMIFLQIYTAQLAGLLAAKNIRGTVTSVDDLKGGQFDVVFPADLTSSVAAAGVEGTEVSNWASAETSAAYFWLMDNANSDNPSPMPLGVKELLDGPLGYTPPDALLLKSSEAALAEAEYCNLYVVGKPFQTTTTALAFPTSASETTLLAFSMAQARMQEATAFYDDSKITSLINTFKTKTFEAAKCPGKAATSKNSQIKFKQITGLLIVLAAGVGVAALFVGWAFRKRSTREWQRAHYRAMRPRW
ncbi:hypothetical protein ABPG75_014086, partial [Micractinium tetrahymenae]